MLDQNSSFKTERLPVLPMEIQEGSQAEGKKSEKNEIFDF